MSNKSISFFALRIFSATGGIEKVCRIVSKALYEFGEAKAVAVSVNSMYDKKQDAVNNAYIPAKIFTGWSGRKLVATAAMVLKGRRSGLVILSHINLLPIGYIIKKISPSVKLVLFAHGIEIWDELPQRKKKMLHVCDAIWAVSRFTRKKIIQRHGINENKVYVLNNALDPVRKHAAVTTDVRSTLHIPADADVLFTLTRLAHTEQNKGYDKVMEAMLQLRGSKAVHYIIGGKYTSDEYHAIQTHAARLGLENKVHLPGFIPDEQLKAYFSTANVFILPSRKEGFGIVFIEAMSFGIPVIGGNVDGSMDALKDGELGVPVSPDSVEEIATAIQKVLQQPEAFRPNIDTVNAYFGFDTYKRNFNTLLQQALA